MLALAVFEIIVVIALAIGNIIIAIKIIEDSYDKNQMFNAIFMVIYIIAVIVISTLAVISVLS